MKINNLSTNNIRVEKVNVTAYKADGTFENIDSAIISEHFMELFVNEQKVMEINCTNENLENLVVGRLITEGIVKSAGDIESIQICEEGLRASVFLKGEITFTNAPRVEATCCTQNVTLKQAVNGLELKKVPDFKWEREWIFKLANVFSADSKIHKATKGTHSCYLMYKGEVVASFEDIGRHNALDKAIGYAAINDLSLNECILFTTGRVPTDMAKKVIMAGVPVLVSKAVPTDKAIELAREYNLTLICKAWPDQFEVFA